MCRIPADGVYPFVAFLQAAAVFDIGEEYEFEIIKDDDGMGTLTLSVRKIQVRAVLKHFIAPKPWNPVATNRTLPRPWLFAVDFGNRAPRVGYACGGGEASQTTLPPERAWGCGGSRRSPPPRPDIRKNTRPRPLATCNFDVCRDEL